MKISTFTIATDPVSMGFPVFEAIDSFLSFSDEVVIVVGRDTEFFCEKAKQISSKIKIIETNKWPVSWTYDVMTDHLNVGIDNCTGDIALKIDLDSIFPDQHSQEIRNNLISSLSTSHSCCFDRLNYYHGFGFMKKCGDTFFAFNKSHLDSLNIKYSVGSPSGSNVLMIDGKQASHARITNTNVLPRNYDDTFCTEKQGVTKYFHWGIAHEKKLGRQLLNVRDISTPTNFNIVKNQWYNGKRKKAIMSKESYEHPNVISQRLLNTHKNFI